MYRALSTNDEPHCSNPTHTLLFHDPPLPRTKTEIFITVTPEDSLYGLALKYNLKFSRKNSS